MEKPKKHEERLMAVLAFDEDDLEANRTGHFSQQQVARFRSKRKKEFWSAAVMSSLLLGFLFFMADILPTENFLLSLIAGLLALGTMWFAYGLIIFRLGADLKEDHVLSTEGRIELSQEDKNNEVNSFITIGGLRFPVNRKTLLAFKNGDPYAIYYTRRSKKLLSAEWLRGEDNLLSPAEIDARARRRTGRRDHPHKDAPPALTHVHSAVVADDLACRCQQLRAARSRRSPG